MKAIVVTTVAAQRVLLREDLFPCLSGGPEPPELSNMLGTHRKRPAENRLAAPLPLQIRTRRAG
jgi:hypothetical protein